MTNSHPLANRNFLKILESSGSVGEQTGWLAHHFEYNNSILPSYIKLHSYGEYIFDWNWANFYQSHQIPYYPKLLHAIPFSPVNAPKFLGNKDDFSRLAKKSYDFYQQHNLSSEHYLFINDQEEILLHELGFVTQLTHQYHFHNKYESFEHFLDFLRKNKRKNIKKERKLIAQSNLEIERLTRDQLTDELLEEFYIFYISTITKKGAYPYLTKSFFTSLDKNQTMIVKASTQHETVAMALFFYNSEALYGRLWGIMPEFENHYPYLHFELCYYQGIDYCLEKKIPLFEAGAQGEHKLLRGFKPVIIKSAHHIKIPQAFEIIQQDIKRKNEQTLKDIEILKLYLPYKS